MRAIALGLLLVLGCDKGGPTREELARQKAAAEAAQAASDAKAKLESQKKQLDDLDAKLVTAVNHVVDAQSDAERAAANAELKALQAQKAELVRDMEGGRPKVKMSTQCIDNPLAKGCS